MGLFGLFKKKLPKKNTSTKSIDRVVQIHNQLMAEDEKFNKELATLQRADAEYKIDHDLKKVIGVYQTVLDGCTWNTFNYQKKLAAYYTKAAKYDDAWQVLSQAQHDAVKRGHGPACTGQIRMEQFKVLKAQKKYKQALETLCRAYVVNNAPYGTWNRESFIKNAKTCAKEMSLTEQQLESIADLVEKSISKNDTSETNIRQAYSAYFK
ncbi:MAG: hypothetical protein IJM56_08050 [Clostridia bacterium]|nr:hypothetical protein [Clostridia bacterium]